MMKPYDVTSLKPGFIIVTYNPELIDPSTIHIEPKEWEELKRKGYSGGLIVTEDVTFHSLDDALMNDLGWQRITRS